MGTSDPWNLKSEVRSLKFQFKMAAGKPIRKIPICHKKNSPRKFKMVAKNSQNLVQTVLLFEKWQFPSRLIYVTVGLSLTSLVTFLLLYSRSDPNCGEPPWPRGNMQARIQRGGGGAGSKKILWVSPRTPAPRPFSNPRSAPDMLGLRPPGFEFWILCPEGSVISLISPSSGGYHGRMCTKVA